MQNKKIISQFPAERQGYIRRNLVSKKTINESGVQLIAPDEIFVKMPGRWKEYVATSYGRVFSLKKGYLHDITQCDSGDYKVVTLYSLPNRQKRWATGTQRTFTVQQIMGMVFLPNYWNVSGKQDQVHHCDHNPHNNYWKNLVRVPVWHHKKLNNIQQVWLRSPGSTQFRRRTYYEIASITGVALDDILKLLAATEEFVAEQGGKYLRCYDIGQYTVGFQMTGAYNNRHTK